MITYRVDVADTHSHHYRVTLTVEQPAPELVLALPVWIAGSYMVREFGRHLSGLTARQGRREVALTQLDKTSWRAQCSGRGALVVSYRVYAFDTSVRTAFLDAQRGFFNSTSLCLQVLGRSHEPHRLSLGRLPAGWQVATALAVVPDGRVFEFEAADYDELVDHPVELGHFWRGSFKAGGVVHEMVVAGALPGFDGQRLLNDTRRICEQEINFWHAQTPSQAASPLPFDRYLFLLNAVEHGYGGLEHRNSTALIAARRDLPCERVDNAGQGMPGGASKPGHISDGYATLLGLISHEYFHTWNVKRLKPAELATLDYSRENYTELLWFFEGFTSYYDDLFLLRGGLIDLPRYLRLLAKSINAVAATPGRLVQSLAQSSFDAWVKYYRSDENTPNATVSYYLKGSLVALALDISLRGLGASLDDVMRLLWQRGKQGVEGGSAGGPITEADIKQAVLSVAAGVANEAGGAPGELAASLVADLHDWVHGTDELPLADLLQAVGLEQRPERAPFSAALGLRLTEGPVSGVQVKSVLVGSVAAAAGVSAGDELLAVDGWRVRRLDEAQTWVQRDQPFELLLVRDQRVLTLRVRPDALSPLSETVSLHLQDKPSRPAAALRLAWLNA